MDSNTRKDWISEHGTGTEIAGEKVRFSVDISETQYMMLETVLRKQLNTCIQSFRMIMCWSKIYSIMDEEKNGLRKFIKNTVQLVYNTKIRK